MQRSRMRSKFWQDFNQFSPFKIPQQLNTQVQFNSNWQWPDFTSSVRGALIDRRIHYQSRGFSVPFSQTPERFRFQPPFPSSGHKARASVPPHFSKSRAGFIRFPNNFHLRRRRRGFKPYTKPLLNPNDPLNLQDLMHETDRRRIEGLSPLRGDSRLNTPALSVTELSNASPATGTAATPNSTNLALRGIGNARDSKIPPRTASTRRGRYFPRHFRRGRWQGKRLPVTGNYPDYYCRRDPEDRLKFLMSEWFTDNDVADYGCHNGTLTFCILNKFPNVSKIDAFDCDPELIENAKNMQRERIRWQKQNNINYEKINFQVANWSDCTSFDDEPTYNTILAFSVTKWIHLNYGDSGLMRFFRRVFNLLKPGGHLLLEPQPKSSYKNTRFTTIQQENFKKNTIDPSNLEPLLLDVGFSYFDKIKIPRPHEPFQRSIILCSKSYGATPSSIRNDYRSETQLWRDSPSSDLSAPLQPPPVNYCPLTPSYASIISPATFPIYEPTPPDCIQSDVVSTTELFVSSGVVNDNDVGSLASFIDDPDVTISAPDSTSEQ